MNRFRTKKSKKDDVTEAEASPTFRAFRKGKKTQEVEKAPVDIAVALPSNDDFRTSLLMTGLSARFSMLREQDDPNTKIGKASDDSVLFPKRQSRMDFTAMRGLTDIAEVQSIRAPPSFARTGSFNSADDAESLAAGSVMGRSKPIEGNNLFGGRQKIYKIPLGAASSKTVGGGMGGRALYEDDVSMSAFQRWRQTEKERKSSENERDVFETRNSDDLETEEAPQPESPMLGNYNRRRETSSTTSSIPSMARNSTAATSVTSSHPAPSVKDWQSSASSVPTLERSVTRTRRLYESGLNHDLQEQQSSALTRIDTLSRQRTFTNRTPDLSTNSPSPTATGHVERWGSERKILAKASAPNLRSMSPPASGSSIGTPDLVIRRPSVGETRSNFGGGPPLSPPISEADENSALHIGPNDRGKATAMGVFQRPVQPYDESRYAQRQLQRQHGRETPTQMMRSEPNPFTNNRSRSSSSSRRQRFESRTEVLVAATQPPLKEDVRSTSFFSDGNESEDSPAMPTNPVTSPQLVIRRPSDSMHPAFRDSAIPTPLSVSMKLGDDPSPTGETPSSLAPPLDSPTLGPTTGSGLSGMVRQHLRGDSNASSIYGALSPPSGVESRFPVDPQDANAGSVDYAAILSPWDSSDQNRDWNLDIDVNEPVPDAELTVNDTEEASTNDDDFQRLNRTSRDEFASQLADGARRVRERLTTYVETDSRSPSPHRPGEMAESMDLPPPSRPNDLGVLRSKGSFGSLADRGRDAAQSKAMKLLGLSNNNSANASQTSSPPREQSRDKIGRESKPSEQRDLDSKSMDDGEEMHAGLRAFRQARREMQRLKEQELRAKYGQNPNEMTTEMSGRSTPMAERPPQHVSPERDQRPPVAFHQQRNRSQTSGSSRERDQSGYESSNSVRPESRQTRGRHGSDNRQHLRLAPTDNDAMSRPHLRSPGLPGTDIRRSPIMPPQPHPNATARMNHSNFAANGNLYAQKPRGYPPSQPSPVSPLPPTFSHSGPPTPVFPPSGRRPSAPPQFPSRENAGTSVPPHLNDAMRRRVRPGEISEPTFVMSTSRVPTVELPPEAAGNRSRSNSRSAPPVPPINPRRRQDSSKSRTVFESLTRRREDSIGEGNNASTPNLPLLGSGFDDKRSNFSISDEEDARANRRRIHKQQPDMSAMTRMHSNPPPIHVGPPASRMVVTGAPRRPGMGMPGGMI